MPSFDSSKFKDFGDFMKSHVRDSVRRGALSAAMRMVEIIKAEIIPSHGDRAPVDKGIYRAGWEFRQTTDGGVDVFNAVPYAPYIEHGVRGENVKISRAMIDALTEWVKRKGLVSSHETRGSRRVRKADNIFQDEARQAAWAIAMNMQKQGIFNRGEGLGILKEVRARIPDILREEIKRELNAGSI